MCFFFILSRTISNNEFPDDCPSVSTRDQGQWYGNHENKTESITCEVSTEQPRDSHSPCSDTNRLRRQVTTRSIDNIGYHPYFINLQTNTSPTPETKTDTSVPRSTCSEISYTPRDNVSHTDRGGTVRFEPVYGETSEEISNDNAWDRKCLPYFVGFAFFLNVILGGIAIGLLRMLLFFFLLHIQ